MRASLGGREVALEIVRQWEGLGDGDAKKAGLQMYKSQEDDGWTIGYGHKLTKAEQKKYADGISETQAEALLVADIGKAEKALETKVTVPLDPNQEGALISLVFNIGTGAFAKSTVLKLVNEQRHEEVPAAIRMWDKVTVGGKKVVSAGLANRRKHEAFIYARAIAPKPAPMMQTRTIAGSVTSAGATAGGGVIEIVQEAMGPVQEQLSGLALYLDIAKYVLIVLALAGLGLVIYARISDRKAGAK